MPKRLPQTAPKNEPRLPRTREDAKANGGLNPLHKAPQIVPKIAPNKSPCPKAGNFRETPKTIPPIAEAIKTPPRAPVKIGFPLLEVPDVIYSLTLPKKAPHNSPISIAPTIAPPPLLVPKATPKTPAANNPPQIHESSAPSLQTLHVTTFSVLYGRLPLKP